MATRSRLGRDPLSDVAQPATAKKNTRSGKAKAGSKTAPKRQTAKAAPGKNSEAAATAAVKASTPDVDVIQEQVMEAAPLSPSVAAVAEAADIPPKEQVAEAQEQSTSPEELEETASSPTSLEATETPNAEETVVPEASGEAVLKTAVAQPETETAGTAPVACAADQTPGQLSPDMHPVAVFLRGVLDGLDQDNSIRVSVTVAPSAYALPVEKLFYFSHAIQLIVSPLEWPGNAWKRPVAVQEPFPSLTAILAAYPGGKHSLRIYDNGLFFSSYYPEMGLGMEALRPLMLFITQRNGSICLKQGRAVEFEIIG